MGFLSGFSKVGFVEKYGLRVRFYYTSTIGDDYRGYNRNEFNGSGIYYCKKQVLGCFAVNCSKRFITWIPSDSLYTFYCTTSKK